MCTNYYPLSGVYTDWYQGELISLDGVSTGSFLQHQGNDKKICDESYAVMKRIAQYFFSWRERSRITWFVSRGISSPLTPVSPMSVGHKYHLPRVRKSGYTVCLSLPYTLKKIFNNFICWRAGADFFTMGVSPP